MKNLTRLSGLVLTSLPALLSAQTAAAPASGTPNNNWMLIPIMFVFGVFYFLVFRPQKQQQKQQQAILKTLKRGDEVITASGIHGKISSVTEQTVMLEIADNIRIKLLKSQVQQIVTPAASEGKK